MIDRRWRWRWLFSLPCQVYSLRTVHVYYMILLYTAVQGVWYLTPPAVSLKHPVSGSTYIRSDEYYQELAAYVCCCCWHCCGRRVIYLSVYHSGAATAVGRCAMLIFSLRFTALSYSSNTYWMQQCMICYIPDSFFLFSTQQYMLPYPCGTILGVSCFRRTCFRRLFLL